MWLDADDVVADEDCCKICALKEGDGWIENKIEACRTIYSSLQALDDTKAAIATLLRAFTYSAPKSEDCCTLGRYFLERGDYSSSIFWYESALSS